MQIVNNLFATFRFILCVSNVNAQTTYNRVTLDRGKDDETNCIYIYNDNADSVKVFIQYKIGNRETNWIDYPIVELIPPSIDPQRIGCVDSTIIGLKLVDVIIVRDKSSSIDNTIDEDVKCSNGFFQKLKSIFK